MRLLWYFSRPFYMLGLPFAVLILLAAINSAPRYASGMETKQILLVASIAYFLFGVGVLWLIPSMFRSSLYAKTKAFFENGFKSDYQFISVMLNRLICFDNNKRQILYIDTDKQQQKLFKWDDLQRWSIENRGKLMLLKIETIGQIVEIVCKNDREAESFLHKFFQS